jgi:hypothetical protein
VRTLADAVTIRALTLWSGREDTARTFALPAGAFEVPAKAEWGVAWTYAATSTDGTTHLRVQSKVTDPRAIVWLEDGRHTSYETIKVESILDVSGDRTGRIVRTVWWARDLGVPAQVEERSTLTTSRGTPFRRRATATLTETTPAPESLNRQLTGDHDGDGVPDQAP